MENKPETRTVHNEADLERLVAGDRVVVDMYSSRSREGYHPFPTPVAYEGNAAGKERFLLNLEAYGVDGIRKISVERKYLSFDPDGTVVIHESHSRTFTYLPSTPGYSKKLSVLKQAGLHKHG